ncbi:MAG: tetratricopeptide repeat protein [Elusimicrobia bacterium]|nr:tetratricopeptide repeat protein [Elusimicrobiota bacterium]
MRARTLVVLACAAAALPCRADWRDVPSVKGVCSAGCGDPGRAAGRSAAEYEPPAPTPTSIAYRHGQAGAAEQKAGDWAAAERSYRAALELDPRSHNGSVYAYQLGYSLLMQDRWSEAEAALRGSLALRDYAFAHNNLAFVLEKLGRVEEAEEEYLAAVRMEGPGSADSESRLAGLADERWNAVTDKAFKRALSQDGAAAEASWRRYLLVDPGSSAAYNNLALALRDQGRYLEAEAALREAARLNPDNERAGANLEAVRAKPGYSTMLRLARGTEFWSALAADTGSDPTKWLAMRCFDDGCSLAQDRAQDVRLITLTPKTWRDVPRPLRGDSQARALSEEKEGHETAYRERVEALKAVWSRKEGTSVERGALGLLELEHKKVLSAARGAIHKDDAAIEKRYQDLGFVVPKRP